MENNFDMRWLVERLDNMERASDEKFNRLSDEIVRSRHGLREVMETIGIQVAALVPLVNEHERRITSGEDSHRRKGDRIGRIERRQSFQTGGIAMLAFLFPITVGAVLAIVVRYHH